MRTTIYNTTTSEAIAIIAKRFPTFNSLPLFLGGKTKQILCLKKL